MSCVVFFSLSHVVKFSKENKHINYEMIFSAGVVETGNIYGFIEVTYICKSKCMHRLKAKFQCVWQFFLEKYCQAHFLEEETYLKINLLTDITHS